MLSGKQILVEWLQKLLANLIYVRSGNGKLILSNNSNVNVVKLVKLLSDHIIEIVLKRVSEIYHTM